MPSLAMEYAPNYHGGLAKHEWSTHGTCTGLSAEDYFKEALRLMLSFPRTDRGTPEIILKNVGDQVPVPQLRESYPKQVGIKINREGVLEEITSCFEKRSDTGKAGKQVDCPDHVMKGFRNNVCNKNGKCKQFVKIPRLNQCDQVKKAAEASLQKNPEENADFEFTS